jgi:hypothetical protein
MKYRIKKVISFNTILLIIFIGYYFLNTKFNLKIYCPFYKLTNLFCPGCGITRCLFSILKLDFKSAFNYNMLVFILLPFLIIYYIYLSYIYILEKENKIIKKIPNYLYYILIIITISFGILRNIEMFKFLSP